MLEPVAFWPAIPDPAQTTSSRLSGSQIEQRPFDPVRALKSQPLCATTIVMIIGADLQSSIASCCKARITRSRSNPLVIKLPPSRSFLGKRFS